MDLDWVNVSATFGSALAGSYLGYLATTHQTREQRRLADEQRTLAEEHWRREKACELIASIDSFVAVSYRPHDTSLAAFDEAAKRLRSLTLMVLGADDAIAIQRKIAIVRPRHLDKPAHHEDRGFTDFSSFFESVSEKLINKFVRK